MPNNLDILIKLLLDNSDFDKKIGTSDKKLEDLLVVSGKTTGGQSFQFIIKDLEKVDQKIDQTKKKFDDLLAQAQRTGGMPISALAAEAPRKPTRAYTQTDFFNVGPPAVQPSHVRTAEALALEEQAQGAARAWNELGRIQGEVNQKGVQGTKQQITGLAAYGAELKELTRDYRGLFNASQRLQDVTRQLFIAGAVVTGGIFAAANKYVTSATEATATTIAWKKATDDLTKVGQRAGAVLAETTLPKYEKIVELAERAVTFLEAHPALAEVALNTGVILLTLGVIGQVLSKGIRLVVDVAFLAATSEQLAAAYIMKTAATEQLAAASIQGGAVKNLLEVEGSIFLRGLPATLKAFAAALAPIAIVAASIPVGLAIGNAAGRKLYGQDYKNQGIPDLFITTMRLAALANAEYFSIMSNSGIPIIRKFGEQMTEAGIAGVKLFEGLLQPGRKAWENGIVQQVAGSTNEKQLVEAFQKYQQAEIDATADTERKRLEIIQEAGAAQVSATQKFNEAIATITSNATDARLSALQNYERDIAKAEADYYKQRADIIRDGGVDIARIEEDLQEKLRKLRRDHLDKLADLEGARDAFGIVREQRDYRRQRDDEIRSANIEIRRRRQDLARKLEDLAANFAAEQAQRQQQLQLQLADIAKQEQEKLAQAREAYLKEQKQIADQERKKLQDLQDQSRREAEQRRNAFIEQLRSLNEYLFNDAVYRNAGYANALTSLQNFINDFNARIGTLGTGIPQQAMGGYSAGGLTMMHPHEFVLSRRTTQAVEQAIGGGLNQQNILGALGGGGQTIVIRQEGWRFSGEISPADRREVKKLAYEGAMEALGDSQSERGR